MKDLPTEHLQNIYNYFTYDQVRLQDMFVKDNLPGMSESLEAMVEKKVLKKKVQLGGFYYYATDKFDEVVSKELSRRT